MKIAKALNKDRKGWTAIYEIVGDKVIGQLLQNETLVREKFKVSRKLDGKFKVDIGTGSGVNITFQSE